MYFEEIKIIKNHRQNSGFPRKTSFRRILPAHTLLHTDHFRLESNFDKKYFRIIQIEHVIVTTGRIIRGTSKS